MPQQCLDLFILSIDVWGPRAGIIDSTFKIECLFIEKVDSTIKIECLLMLFHSKRVAPYIPKIAKTQMKKQEHYTFGNITNPLQVDLMQGGFP